MTTPQKLYSVTLFWGNPDSDEGDYSSCTWAQDEDAALRHVAEEMADSGEPFSSPTEREEYIKGLISNAGTYAAIQVTGRVPELEMLLKGPLDEWTPESKADFEAVQAILDKYAPAS